MSSIRIGAMTALCWALPMLAHHAVAAPFLEQQTLFQCGDAGYAFYRIPSLVTTTHGTILAFSEGRKDDGSDFGNIDLMLRRSEDGGRTWSEIQCVADDGTHIMGNPCPVVDRSTGTIWLPFTKDYKKVLLTKSNDDGRTWAAPVDITHSAVPADVTFLGTGPGHGIQLASGRLLIPCWMDSMPTMGEVQSSYAFYSDDHGAAWKAGEPMDSNASDECEAVQLADGRVYMNMRSRQGKHQRAYALSSDGGHTWSSVKYDPNLPEPECAGGLVRLTDALQSDRNRVLLACPANPQARDTLTVRLSYDECRTWPVSKVLHAGSSLYVDLAVTDDHHILCLYETDVCARIALARFNIEWLTNGKDVIGPKAK